MPDLNEDALDAAILKALYPEERKTEITLSAEVENSGGAIRVGFRCLKLEQRGLVYCAYATRDAEHSYWKLTVRGRLALQNFTDEGVATTGGTE